MLENILGIAFDITKNIVIFGASAFIVSFGIAPTQFLKIRRQSTGKQYMDIFTEQKNLFGWSRLYIAALPYALISLYISCLFGFSEYIASQANTYLNLESRFLGVVLKSLIAGTLETLVTIRPEVREISKNKGELMESKGKSSQIFTSALARNSLSWFGSIMAFYFISEFKLGFFKNALISLFCGATIGFITIPFDILTTLNCGNPRNLGFFQGIRCLYKSKDRSILMRGSVMRVFQSAIFTTVNTICEFLAHHH